VSDPTAPEPADADLPPSAPARPAWGAASDLSRVLPTGSAQPAAPRPSDGVGQPTPDDQLVELAAVSPPSGRRQVSSGLALGRAGRIVVGILLAAVLGFMLYNAWRNVSSL
jgi:hypothetical protein